MPDPPSDTRNGRREERSPTRGSEGPRWPVHLRELCRALLSPADESARQEIRGEVWLLLNTVISRYLRIHAAELGRISREDQEDIAAKKSLDLLLRAEQGEWKTSDRAPPEIAAFLSKVARNGLLDRLAERRRLRPAEESGALDTAVANPSLGPRPAASPELLAERREFASALRLCCERLKPRWRSIWFFRVFLGMSSREIAAHPEVNLKPGHVDVLLQRSRRAMRECMRRRGFEPGDMPPGTFAEMWRTLRLDESDEPRKQPAGSATPRPDTGETG